MKYLVTGTAGFIGYNVARRLLARGDEVVGLDNINDYYDPELKLARLAELGIDRDQLPSEDPARGSDKFVFYKADLADTPRIQAIMSETGAEAVCHLAAQAGVRYSLENPHAYAGSNLVGFLNILEGCRAAKVRHLVFASSSSVYGLNESMPFSVHDNVDHPVSLYAASKKSNELMAHSYSHLFDMPVTGLRFFTVYGPYGRPDMALFLFTKAILENRPIRIFNNGQMSRDFTYIDDIADGVVRVLDAPPAGNAAWAGTKPDPASSRAPYRIYNIGNGAPVKLLDFVSALEEELGIEARKEMMPMQPGDVPATWADTTDFVRDFKVAPAVSIREGIRRFVAWYKEFYGID